MALAVLLALDGCADAAGSPALTPGSPGSPPATSIRTSAPATPSPSPTTPAPAVPTTTPAPDRTPSPTPAPAPGLRVGGAAFVAVTVATGWHSSTSPRSVDAPALANPVRIREWLAGLSPSQQAGLIGRVDTQVLLGDRVLVIELTRTWARVLVTDQATPIDARGYPVWIPRRQLTAIGPAASPAAPVATIVVPTAWLLDRRGARIEEASFATRLPVLARARARVEVALPGGRTAWLPSASVSVRPPGERALTPSATSLVATARKFLGLRYLWGGTSGFGFDCSGLVYLVYRVHGIALPRDAGPQAVIGAAVAPASREPGDLVFFARNGDVHHIAIWIGGGAILEAPQVGAVVRVARLAGLPYRNELTVTRRVLR